MNWFENLTLYRGSWEESKREALDESIKSQLAKAEVIFNEGRHDDDWDIPESLQVKLTLKDGRTGYMKLSTKSQRQAGDVLDLDKIVVITLSRAGDDDLTVLDGEKK